MEWKKKWGKEILSQKTRNWNENLLSIMKKIKTFKSHKDEKWWGRQSENIVSEIKISEVKKILTSCWWEDTTQWKEEIQKGIKNKMKRK